jgi:hypothetical protein
MISVYVGESRGGHIKLTTDKDCLSPDIIRFDERLVPEGVEFIQRLLACKDAYERRGFTVCIDTMELFYETPDNAIVTDEDYQQYVESLLPTGSDILTKEQLQAAVIKARLQTA